MAKHGAAEERSRLRNSRSMEEIGSVEKNSAQCDFSVIQEFLESFDSLTEIYDDGDSVRVICEQAAGRRRGVAFN